MQERAWRFVAADAGPLGEAQRWRGEPLRPYVAGLAASTTLVDALRHAEGDSLEQVELGGESVCEGDRWFATELTPTHRFNAAEPLREFMHQRLLRLRTLYTVPDAVLRYLSTGQDQARASVEAEACLPGALARPRNVMYARALIAAVTAPCAAMAARAFVEITAAIDLPKAEADLRAVLKLS